MDEPSSDDAPPTPQYQPNRPSRGSKPAGFYRATKPLPPTASSKSDTMQRDTGKRKREDSPPNGDSGERGGSGDGKGNPEEEPKRKTVPKPKPKPKPKERTPPSDCEAREVKRDHDLKITEAVPKMQEGAVPRFYAKIVRDVERLDSKDEPFDKPIEESYRMPNHPPIILAAVDLSLLRTPDCTHILPDRELVRFAMDPAVLPLLKQWAYMWLNSDNESKKFHGYMKRTFPMEGPYGKPWEAGIRLIAEHAARGVGFTYTLAPLLYAMSSFARRLVNANGAFFDSFSEYSRATDEPHKFAARLLLIVWEDVEINRNGFFRVLLKGELARPNRPEMRTAYEGWYIVDERLFQ